MVNAATGEIGINLWSSSPITTTEGGSLATISLHVRDTAPVGSTGLTLVNQVNPNGNRLFTTTVSDPMGAFILHPAQTATGVEPGAPGSVTVCSGQNLVRSGQWAVGSGNQMVVDQLSNTLDLTAHCPLPTAHLLDQIFGDTALVQESMFAQPSAIMTTQTGESSVGIQDKALVQPLAEQDWVSAELLEHLGRGELGTLEDADLTGLEAFFAKEGISSRGA